MKILTVVGARPQFIKAAVVSRAIGQDGSIQEVIVHTGQHYDENMSNVFFSQLGIPRPHYQCNVNSGSHGSMTGRMLEEIELIIFKEKPERVLVYGDTNSTLAGALAAAKLSIPVAHVEAGLRSFNMRMPEEINRILTDQISDMLLCPTEAAVKNLEREGFNNKPVRYLNVGDVMQDCAMLFTEYATEPKGIDVRGDFVLATFHRAENTDKKERLVTIVKALNHVHRHVAPVVLPLHPRTRAALNRHNLDLLATVIDPVGYFEMLWLLKNSSLVMTDSGGLQKEAFFFSKYCVTLRDQTEWIELVENEVNSLVGADFEAIILAAEKNINAKMNVRACLYGSGNASGVIVRNLVR
jgi:UDP-GlcNAc3NAcA epimerase